MTAGAKPPVDPRLLRVPAVRRLLATRGVVQASGAALTVAQAVLLSSVVVAIFVDHADAAALLPRLAELAAVGLGRAAFAASQEWVTARASLRLRARLRRMALDAVVHAHAGWAARQPAGRLVSALGPAADAVDGYVSRALPAFVGALVVPPVVLAAIMWRDLQSGLLLLAALPLVPLFMVLIGIATRRLVDREYAVLARLSGRFLDLLRGLATLRIYGRAEEQERTLRRANDDYRAHAVATLRVALLSGLVLDLVAALSVAVVAVDVGLRLDGGTVSFAAALLVLLLAPELFAPLRAVGAQHHAAEEGAAAVGALLDIVDAARPETPDGASGRSAERAGRVRLHHVAVRYPNRADAALRDIDLEFEPGRLIALTGPSGAGKSSLIAVLLGFVTPAAGKIYIGPPGCETELTPADAAQWRLGLAWVPQRPRPTQPTVAEEVRLGAPQADSGEVAEVCALCRAPDPDVALGEDGREVSAGQRRRIALARALLRARAVRAEGGVPLVLLDEPSEDLDRATEQIVAHVITELAAWATVVIATHSAVLIDLADVQVRLDAGRVRSRSVQSPYRVLHDSFDGDPVPRHPLPVAQLSQDAGEPYRLRELAREAHARRRLVGAAGLAALAALAGLGLTATSMWLISRAAQHPNLQALAVAVVGVRTFAVGRAVLRYGERLATHDAALRMLAALRSRVFTALRPLPPAVLGGYGRGDLLRRFVGDVDGVQEGLVRAVVPAVGALAGALGAVALVGSFVPAAGAVLAVGLVAGGMVVPAAAFGASGEASELVRAAGARDRRCAGLLEGLAELIAYGAADREVAEVAALDRRVARAARRPARAAAAGVFGTGLCTSLTLAGVLAVAADAVAGGRLPGVDAAVLAAGVIVGFDAMSGLPSAAVAWARCRAGLVRVRAVTSLRPPLGEPAVPASVPTGPIGLAASHVTLAPVPGARPVLRNTCLELPPGRRLALRGPSGCGKTTFLAAALRMVPITAGRFRVSGSDGAAELSELPSSAVPPLVAGSLQGDHVFEATLRDNLRLVRPGASDADLDVIAERVGLSGFLRSLPSGWSTPAGADGSALSGGQRQRLLLARALLADPDVLVLDEPTAHLDAVTERLVLDDLLDATADRTVLLVTHRRLDTLAEGLLDGSFEIADATIAHQTEARPSAG